MLSWTPKCRCSKNTTVCCQLGKVRVWRLYLDRLLPKLRGDGSSSFLLAGQLLWIQRHIQCCTLCSTNRSRYKSWICAHGDHYLSVGRFDCFKDSVMQ